VGAESFTLLAILEARDRASEIFAKVDESLDKFAGTAERAAGAAKGAGDSIDESLLKTASGADALELASARVSAAQERATRTAEEQADAERGLLEAHQAAAGAADDDVAAQYRLMEANERLAAASKENAAAQKTLSGAEKLQADTAKAVAAKNDEAAAAQTRAGKAGEKSGASFGKAGKIAGIMALGLGVAAGVMVKAAGNFQDSTQHLVTDAGETQGNLAMVRAGILNVSTATGTSAEAITAAMYHVESAGYHGAQGLAVLKIAAEGARVGGADLDTIGKTLTGTLNAYGMTSSNAGKQTHYAASMMNQLIATVGAGDMRMQDLASSLGNVAPVAAAAKIRFSDVGGALATMTAQNMSAQQATQDLRHTILSLQSPNKVAQKELGALGLSATDLSKNMGKRGLAATLNMVATAAKQHSGALGQTYTQAMYKAMGGTTGLTTALMLTGGRLSTFQHNAATVAAAARKGGDTVDNWGKIQSTFNFKLDQAKTGVENTGIAIGTALLPAVTAILSAVTKVVIPIAEWTAKNKTLTEILFVGVAAIAATIAVIAGAAKAYKAVKGAIDDVGKAANAAMGLLKKLGIISGESSGEQAAAADAAAAEQEADAGAVAVANEEGAAESSSSWLASMGQQAAAGVSWAAQSVAKVAVVVARNVAGAAATAASWAASAAGMAVQGAVWAAQSLAKVAVVVAGNIAGALATAAAWVAANAVMLLGIGLVVAAVAGAVYEIVTHWHDIVHGVEVAWDDVYDFISKIISDVISFVKSHWTLIVGLVAGPLGLAVTQIVRHWDDIKHWFSDGVQFVQHVLSWFTGLPGMFGRWIAGAASAVWNAGTRFLAWYSSLPGKILGWLSGLPGQMVSIGAGIVQGIWNGISGAAGWLMSKIEGFASSIISGIGSALGISSPSKKTYPHGMYLGMGLGNGLIASIPYILGAARRVAGSALSATAGLGAGGAAAGSALAASAVAPAGGGYGGGGGITVVIDVHGNTVMSDSDIDKLTAKIGRQVASQLLPAAGRKISIRG